jgi:hypothetical protein
LTAGLIAYAVALVGFGTASGIDIVAQRRFFSLGAGAHAVASLAGLADLILVGLAFFVFPLGAACEAILIGAVGTVMLAAILPPAPGFVWLGALLGAIATLVHFVG